MNIEFEDNQDDADNFEDIGLDIQLIKLCTGVKATEDLDLAQYYRGGDRSETEEKEEYRPCGTFKSVKTNTVCQGCDRKVDEIYMSNDEECRCGSCY